MSKGTTSRGGTVGSNMPVFVTNSSSMPVTPDRVTVSVPFWVQNGMLPRGGFAQDSDSATQPGYVHDVEQALVRANYAMGRLSGTQPLYARVAWEDMKNLQGGILTILDAVIADPRQLKSAKDLVRNTFTQWDRDIDRIPDLIPDDAA